MSEYREQVRKFAQERTGESFYNRTPSHAADIIDEIFLSAQREVCLLTTALHSEIFTKPDVVLALQRFLSDGSHSLRILFETNPMESVGSGHPFVCELRKHNNWQARQMPGTMVSAVKYHFTVADADSFRYEPDKERCEASAAFGDERNGRKLQDIFDSIWELSEPANLPEPRLG